MIFKAAAFILLVGIASPRTADATYDSTPPRSPVNCNDVITDNETLTKNLNCDCSHEPALTVKQGANLDLAGYKVTCSKGLGTCALIEDEHTLIKDGKLITCETGVLVKGMSNKVAHLDIEDSHDGIVIHEDAMDNEIRDNTITDASDDGIVVYGKENKVKDNTIIEPQDKGILVKGDANLILDNKIVDAGLGIYVEGQTVTVRENEISGTKEKDGIKFTEHAEHGIIKENHVYDTKDDGIDVRGEGILVEGNMVKGAEKDGIDVDADDVQVLYNTVSESGDNGIEAHGDDIKVDHNTVSNSADNGILVFGDDAKICFNDVSYSHENGILFGGDDSTLDENKVTESEGNGIQIGSDEDDFKDDKRNKIFLNEVKASHKDDIFLAEHTDQNDVIDNDVESRIVEVSIECDDRDDDDCCNTYENNSVEPICGGGGGGGGDDGDGDGGVDDY